MFLLVVLLLLVLVLPVFPLPVSFLSAFAMSSKRMLAGRSFGRLVELPERFHVLRVCFDSVLVAVLVDGLDAVVLRTTYADVHRCL